jgi:hypothetical protein
MTMLSHSKLAEILIIQKLQHKSSSICLNLFFFDIPTTLNYESPVQPALFSRQLV